MINSVFREPAVIQSIIIVFLSIHPLIRRGLPLIRQQSLKMLLIMACLGPGLAPVGTETAVITNCHPSAQLVCWGNWWRGMSWLQMAASKGCTATASLHRWDSPRKAPMVRTSGTAAGTSPNTAWRGARDQHHHCCSCYATPGWPNDMLPSVPIWKLPDQGMLPFTQCGLDWAAGEAPQAGMEDEWRSPRPGSATQGFPPGASSSAPSLASRPLVRTPTAKVNHIQQVCEVVRDTKAPQMRGKAGSSLERRENHQHSAGGEEPQCQFLHCWTQRNRRTGLYFGCSQNNLLRAGAEHEAQLDLTTCYPPVTVAYTGWVTAPQQGQSRSKGILQLPDPSWQSSVAPD